MTVYFESYNVSYFWRIWINILGFLSQSEVKQKKSSAAAPKNTKYGNIICEENFSASNDYHKKVKVTRNMIYVSTLLVGSIFVQCRIDFPTSFWRSCYENFVSASSSLLSMKYFTFIIISKRLMYFLNLYNVTCMLNSCPWKALKRLTYILIEI